jgi:hypothetical protein
MSLDVEIYMNGVIKFFNQNPNDLSNLIPLDKKDVFFQKIKEKATENANKGQEVTITQKQMIDICIEINTSEKPFEITHINGPIYRTKYGEFSLN